MPQKDMPWIKNDRLCLPGRQPIPVGTNAWFRWLEQNTHFCYQPPGKTHRLTLRKEKRKRQFYWYAYVKSDRKLHNAYVGKTEALTVQRLHQVFSRLLTKVHQQRQGMDHG
jgi:LuxR family maltose regulon positive regulatory protein